MLGDTYAELGGSEVQAIVHGVTEGRPPKLDLAVEKRLLNAVLAAIQNGLVRSAHDLSEGGLAVALAESCISGGLGANVDLTTELRPDYALFSESQSRILLSAAPEKAEELAEFIVSHGVPVHQIGRVGGQELSVSVNGTPAVKKPVEQLKRVWEDVIPCLMQ
ncbi:Phosphoribosylformylglycinamidine synthase 2 [compost metagenome]